MNCPTSSGRNRASVPIPSSDSGNVWVSNQPSSPLCSFSCVTPSLRIVWAPSCRNEIEVGSGGHVVAIIGDVSGEFEHIGCGVLIRRASGSGYPVTPLNLSVHAFWMKRFPRFAGRVERMGHPTRGIVVGCVAPTCHVASYDGEPLLALQQCIHVSG